LVATAALGGLLFGFDVAIITGAGPFLERHFELDLLALGWAFSSLLFGCVLGSAIAGWIADQYGRRIPLMAVALVFAASSVATGLAPTFTLFIVARFLGGVAVGAESALTPMYISEISPRAMRGRMGAFYQLSIVGGIVVSYCVNYALHDLGPWNWRWMFMTGAAPAMLFWLMLWRVPESPRFLVLKGRIDEASAVLAGWLTPAEMGAEIAAIQGSFTQLSSTWNELRNPALRRPIGIGFVLAILIQFSGIATIVDYAPRIFQSTGWSIDVALFSTFSVGFTMFVFTVVSFWFIDRRGRIPMYVTGSLGMAVALLGLTVAAAIGHFTGGVVLALIVVYLAAFCSCIGPVFWTLVPEILPNRVRGKAMTVPVLTQWVANAIVVLLFPVAFQHVGKVGTFSFLAAVALFQAWFTWRWVPETKGRSLEEIGQFWESDARSPAIPTVICIVSSSAGATNFRPHNIGD
jgi:SP family arabinose:H+ symporter-like MFS transporter